MHTIDHKIKSIYPKDGGNWFNFNGRSYRKDTEAVKTVSEKDHQVRELVELIYVEGDPIPRGSKLNVIEVSNEHLDEIVSKSANKINDGNFLSRLFGG
jgi:hypothetical protein